MPSNIPSRSATERLVQKKWFQKIPQLFTKIPQSRDEIGSLLEQSYVSGIIDDDALGIMEGALRITDMQARDIMIPYSQMCVLKIDDSRDTCLQTIAETGHSRFPVLSDNDSEEEVVGIVLAKDFIRSNNNDDDFDISSILRKSIIIPESKRLSVLLREFREQRYHMALVIDEYGSISGLLTIEDILEEIVGEIEDETDEEETPLIQAVTDTNNRYIVQTQLPIEDFNEYFDCGFSDDDFDTIGGLLLHHFGQIPDVGDCVTIESFTFTIKAADERRIVNAQLDITAT